MVSLFRRSRTKGCQDEWGMQSTLHPDMRMHNRGIIINSCLIIMRSSCRHQLRHLAVVASPSWVRANQLWLGQQMDPGDSSVSWTISRLR